MRSFLMTLLLGAAAANLCVWLDIPLPWMIGPLFATAAARMSNLELYCPLQLRMAGQWAIGTALGLYFTPLVLKAVMSYFAFIAGGVLFALLLGLGCAWFLHKLARIDKTTAFFAMAVGGASEMATQGERHGACVERVAAAHSIRMMLVVAIIPFAYKYWGVHGLEPFEPGARLTDYGGLIFLIMLTSAAAFAFLKMGWPNAWVIGPLLAAVALTASGIHLSALPEWMIHWGQLFIGISLGTRFTPAFLRAAPRYLGSVALCSLAALALAAGFGMALAHASGLHPATAILATSPGGIAEMSLTAQMLELGVPIVTAFHVTRMAVLVLTIGPLFRLLRRHLQPSA